MDKAEVLMILTGLEDTGPIAEVVFDMETLQERAVAIAQVHEEEVAAARMEEQRRWKEQLAIMPCGHHASNAVSADEGAAYCQMCDLEAQVKVLRHDLEARKASRRVIEARAAVMTGRMMAARDALDSAIDAMKEGEPLAATGQVVWNEVTNARHELHEALQSAPKVLHSIKAKRTVNISGDTLLAFPWQEGGVRVVQVYDPAMERYGDEWVDVIVLECSVNQAPGPKSEQERLMTSSEWRHKLELIIEGLENFIEPKSEQEESDGE